MEPDREEKRYRDPTGGCGPRGWSGGGPPLQSPLQHPLQPPAGAGPDPSQPCPEQAPGLTVQDVLVRVRTQGRPGTPTPEDHGLAPQEVSSEARVQLPAWGGHSVSTLSQRHWQAPILPVLTRARHHPPTKVLAKGRLGSCGHRPRPLSTLPGSRWSTCWGRGREGCHLGRQHQRPPIQAVAIACSWSGGWGWKVPSIQGLARWGRVSGTKAAFRPLQPLPQLRICGEHSGSLEEMSLLPSPLQGSP